MVNQGPPRQEWQNISKNTDKLHDVVNDHLSKNRNCLAPPGKSHTDDHHNNLDLSTNNNTITSKQCDISSTSNNASKVTSYPPNPNKKPTF